MPRVVKSKAVATAASRNPVKKGAVAKKNKLYSMPEKIAEGTVLSDLSKGQWRIGPSIGVGGFGEIYSACRLGERNYDYVVKCEPHGNGPLFVEMHFYMRNAKLEDIQHFKHERKLKFLGMPYMLGNGSADINGQKHRFIVMPRYGTDINAHYKKNGNRLPEATIYRIALQMIDVYEFVHSCGYVHADLKAANILLGYGKGGGSQAYLVDYGLASHYTTKDFKPDPKKMHNGTIEYTSRDAHLGVATMRADLEILGYNLIEWLGVQLPWVVAKLLTAPKAVQQAKDKFVSDIGTQLKNLFPEGVPVPIEAFWRYVAKLKYNETPDYNKCRSFFTNALKQMGVQNTGDLDFKLKPLSKNNNGFLKAVATSKAAKKGAKIPAINIEASPSSSSDVICASEDDDDDVIFEPRKVAKVSKKRALKTVASPRVGRIGSPQKMKSTTTPKAPTNISPRKRASTTPQPSPNAKKSKPKTDGTKTPTPVASSKASRVRPSPHGSAAGSSSTSRFTPVSSNAKINFSPSISISKPGKTVINDNLTPNPRSGKTYEFNFELDVSMDANVIVNVKRKKKASKQETSDEWRTPRQVSSTVVGGSSSSDTHMPPTRVKIRKVGDSSSGSPRTPAVTVQKFKR